MIIRPEEGARTRIDLPRSCLVVLMGVSGAGKSTLARKHFLRTEILSSDAFRAIVSDDENDQAATDDAFNVLYCVAEKRLARGRMTVIDATNVRTQDRIGFVHLAKRFHRPAIAIVLNVAREVCFERNRSRTERRLSPDVLCQQADQLLSHLPSLVGEGFEHVHVLTSAEEISGLEFNRE